MKSVFSCLLFSVLALTNVSAQAPFFSFEESFDCPLDDDSPVSWLEGGFPLTMQCIDDDLVLSNPLQLAPADEDNEGFSLGLTVVATGEGVDQELVMAGDTSAQTVFRVNTPGAFGSIYTRSEAGFPGSVGVPDDSDHGAYFGNIRGSGLMVVGSFTKLNEIEVIQTDLRPDQEDVVFQLDTIGNQVTASAWAASEPRPKSPWSVTFTDDEAREPGVFGVSFGGFGDPATDAVATFRSFKIASGLPPGVTDNPGLDGFVPPGLLNGLPATSHHAVPEPATALLWFLGCSLCLCTRSRRT